MSDETSLEKEPHESIFKRLWRGMRPANKSELAQVIAEAGSRDIIDEDTEDMLKGVFDIATLRVSDIMIPRSEMVTIDAKMGLKEATEIIASSGHSRYPVSKEDKDHIVGILNAKDLLPYAVGLKPMFKSLSDIVRPCTVVPETLRVDAMLNQFQENHLHIAVVIDEFGGVCGLVTIEDILELIVGDIADEYDEAEDHSSEIIKNQDNSYEMPGTTLLEDFNEFFKTQYALPDIDTVAGLVMHQLGHIPRQDEQIKIDNFMFKVLESSHHQVKKIQVTKLKTQESNDA